MIFLRSSLLVALLFAASAAPAAELPLPLRWTLGCAGALIRGVDALLERFPGDRWSIGYPRSGALFLPSVRERRAPLEKLAGNPITDRQRKALLGVTVVDPSVEVRLLARSLAAGQEVPPIDGRRWLEANGFPIESHFYDPFPGEEKIEAWLEEASGGSASEEMLKGLRWLARSPVVRAEERAALVEHFRSRGESMDANPYGALRVYETETVSDQLWRLRDLWVHRYGFPAASEQALRRLAVEGRSEAVRDLATRMLAKPDEPDAADLLAWCDYEPAHRRRDARESSIGMLLFLRLNRRGPPSALREALSEILRKERSAKLRGLVAEGLQKLAET